MRQRGTANAQNEESGFQRVPLSRALDLDGWNSHVRREFPGNCESTNLSRRILDTVGRLLAMLTAAV